MERTSNWKKILLLAVFGIFALHINVSKAADDSSQSTSPQTSTSSTDDCVLEAE